MYLAQAGFLLTSIVMLLAQIATATVILGLPAWFWIKGLGLPHSQQGTPSLTARLWRHKRSVRP